MTKLLGLNAVWRGGLIAESILIGVLCAPALMAAAPITVTPDKWILLETGPDAFAEEHGIHGITATLYQVPFSSTPTPQSVYASIQSSALPVISNGGISFSVPGTRASPIPGDPYNGVAYLMAFGFAGASLSGDGGAISVTFTASPWEGLYCSQGDGPLISVGPGTNTFSDPTIIGCGNFGDQYGNTPPVQVTIQSITVFPAPVGVDLSVDAPVISQAGALPPGDDGVLSLDAARPVSVKCLSTQWELRQTWSEMLLSNSASQAARPAALASH
jgi:hypothetical protein